MKSFLTQAMFWTTLFCSTGIFRVQAQQYRPLVVHADLSMPFRKGIGGNVEWHISSRQAVAMGVAWEKHNRNSGLFDGELNADFTELSIDSLIPIGYNKRKLIAYRRYAGPGRPLKVQPDFVALSSISLRFDISSY